MKTLAKIMGGDGIIHHGFGLENMRVRYKGEDRQVTARTIDGQIITVYVWCRGGIQCVEVEI